MGTTADVPMQIYLSQAEVELLQKLAEQQGVTVSEFVRQSIHDFLRDDLLENRGAAEDVPENLLSDPAVTDNPLWGIVGLGRSGRTDVAARHDEYLAEILYEESHPWPKQSS